MVNSEYVPDRGDIVWLEFTPQAGHEQRGRRPALTITPRRYNKKAGLALFCPITSKEKGYPFEVKVQGDGIRGVILADQLKSLDWRIRNAEFAMRSDQKSLKDVIEKITTLITG